MSDEFKTFWMVYLVGQAAPAHRHETEAAARQEALRLVTKYGGEATVLVSVAKCVKRDVFWQKPDMEAPF